MNIHEQIDSFLAELGVAMERPQELSSQPYEGDSMPEISIFQASRDHYGVFYRLDIINQMPELRIMMPVEQGEVKMNIYLVRLNQRFPLAASFASVSAYEGSESYEQGRESALQHLLYATAEMMKHLFWSGDLTQMRFPGEIEVLPLLVQDERPRRRK